MSAALDMLRVIARTEAMRSLENEKNEINERTPIGGRVNSFNSFLSSPESVADEFEERAALVESGARVPREWAEGYAWLDLTRPPGDVPPHQWQTFVDDVGRFLDSGFPAKAAALGWTSFDLFGADREKPFARIDKAGLLWLVNGAKLVALTENTATVEAHGGVRQSFRRRPTAAGQVLAWELVSGPR
jgi:hypothetical protein